MGSVFVSKISTSSTSPCSFYTEEKKHKNSHNSVKCQKYFFCKLAILFHFKCYQKLHTTILRNSFGLGCYHPKKIEEISAKRLQVQIVTLLSPAYCSVKNWTATKWPEATMLTSRKRLTRMSISMENPGDIYRTISEHCHCQGGHSRLRENTSWFFSINYTKIISNLLHF